MMRSDPAKAVRASGRISPCVSEMIPTCIGPRTAPARPCCQRDSVIVINDIALVQLAAARQASVATPVHVRISSTSGSGRLALAQLSTFVCADGLSGGAREQSPLVHWSPSCRRNCFHAAYATVDRAGGQGD